MYNFDLTLSPENYLAYAAFQTALNDSGQINLASLQSMQGKLLIKC